LGLPLALPSPAGWRGTGRKQTMAQGWVGGTAHAAISDT
jgi:hypothetical protein